MIRSSWLAISLLPALAVATEFHVSPSGDDANSGVPSSMLRTISEAADRAQPGDMITVHEGVYRERIDPPRGGTSENARIVYQAAPGEKVAIKGSEVVTGWEFVGNDTWKIRLPSSSFGLFNPYNNLISGDWFTSNGRNHHTGAVYLNGHWLTEAANKATALQAAGSSPLWFAEVDGAGALLNIGWFQPYSGATAGTRVDASYFDRDLGVTIAANNEGGECVGWIDSGDWTRYDTVDFGTGADSMNFRVSSQTIGGTIEARLDGPEGTLLGTATVANTGNWNNWVTVTAPIPPTSGIHKVCLVYRSPVYTAGNTTIYAQFPGKNPNNEFTEINARQSVFYPEETGLDYITVRGFTLEQAATPWSPPTAEQVGLIGTNWGKGWIIEDNTVRYSVCSGISLGKHGDRWDNVSTSMGMDGTAVYRNTIQRATANGWNKASVGGHKVTGNRISHCEQAGIVGSLGCSFSTIANNDIHDVHVRRLFTGAEMANIKLHGAIDVVIDHNHLYNGGSFAVWLDWMAQGAHITGNLMHGQSFSQDLFLEVNHGPILVDHNLFLSAKSIWDASEGVAYCHNLIAGTINTNADSRQTPYHVAHDTASPGMVSISGGDTRFYNNILVSPASLTGYNSAARPTPMDGNVFLKGAAASSRETSPVVQASFDPAIQVLTGIGGYHVKMNADPAWGTARTRPLITTALLGTAVVPGTAFEQPDGTPVTMNADYLAVSRNAANPFPGPFETVQAGANTWKGFNDSLVSAPSGLTATAAFARVTLNWSEFVGSTSYSVKRASASGGPYSILATGLTGTTWTDTTVTSGVTYYYVISATAGATESANSAELAATPKSSIAINAGGPASGSFGADAWYSTGNAYTTVNAVSTSGVADAAPAAVYQSERWGNLTYTVPGLNPGTSYLVRLHFAEIFFGAPGGAAGGVGSRVCNVLVNGTVVLPNFDVFAAAGGANKAVVRDFTAAANASGQITISLAAVVSNAKISGFEILTIPGSYDTWADGMSLSGVDRDKDRDPDADGVSNLLEFATGGNPRSATDHGVSSAKLRDQGGAPALTLTLATRAGASFTAGPNNTRVATLDGVSYRIEGSGNLVDWTSVISEITPALIDGVVATPPFGYEYHTFSTSGLVSSTSREFIRAQVTEVGSP
jgi:alpha-L-arabinofuranosidase